jgi:Asp-tRNA(Asn)/Glu-tRNA(Gln) amidotransferase A subunit family amidase
VVSTASARSSRKAWKPITIAKTNLHEYASGITTISSLGGQTRDPYDAGCRRTDRQGITDVALVMERRLGRSQPNDAYTRRLLNRAELQRELRELINGMDLDAILYPTVRQEATPIGQSQPGSNCSMSANTGFPALTVPAGFTPDGMPIGAELLGLPFTEPTLLGMGYDYEQATHHRVPPASTPLPR